MPAKPDRWAVVDPHGHTTTWPTEREARMLAVGAGPGWELLERTDNGWKPAGKENANA